MPILYDQYFGQSKFAQDDIRVVLQHPRLEFLINYLHIKLRGRNYCAKWDPIRGQMNHGQICGCNKLDEDLGVALSTLLNLELLRLDCSLCPPWEQKRHEFFPTFKTRVLHKVQFDCQCWSMQDTWIIRNLEAKCMASVNTLKWFASKWSSGSEEYLKYALSNENILPNLRYLHCRTQQDPTRFLLQNHPITRLHIWRVNESPLNFEDPRNEQDNLAQMDASITPQDNLVPSLRGTKGNHFPFRSLRHIGTFLFSLPTSSVSQ
jgi:hypothetical protein